MQQQAEKDFSIRANDFEPMAQVLNPAALQQTGTAAAGSRGCDDGWACCWVRRSFSGGR